MSLSLISIMAAVAMAENTKLVQTVQAQDTDSNPITYSLSAGADAAKFAIDATTGILSFIDAPDHDVPGDANADNVYEVEVTATSAAGTVAQMVSVTVTAASDALEKSLDLARVSGQKIAQNKVAIEAEKSRNDAQDLLIAEKTDQGDVDSAISTAVAPLATQTDVDNALATKADSSTVTTQLATKANVTALDGVDGRVDGLEDKYGPDGKLLRQYASDSVLTGQQKVVNTEAEMLALTSDDVQNGDIVIVDTGDEETQASYWVKDDTALDNIASYQKVLTQMDGVFNVVIDGTAENGDVILHKSAKSGKASDQDYTAAPSAGLTSTNTKGALDELGAGLEGVKATLGDNGNYDPVGVFETAYAAGIAQG